MAALFKFRCDSCHKLLGAPASRLGTLIRCPRCGVELVVPPPENWDEPEDEPEGESIRLEDLGLQLGPEPLAPASTTTKLPPPPDPALPDPIAFLQQVAEPEPTEDAPDEPDPEVPPGLPETPDPARTPLVPGRRRRGGALLLESSARRRDVVLPRTATVAWALSSLLGLAFAFTAGLLIGHFLWRG